MGDVHYRFYLDGVLANPIFPDSLSKEFERETGQVFFREKIKGKLRFMVNDYIYILSKPVDHKFTVKIEVHYGYGWEDYWEGFFYLTDCEIDYERECIQVEPDVLDEYTEILDNYDKEFDLIKLIPKQIKIQAKIRGVLQIYIAGQDTITNIVGSTYWEEQCENETSDTVLRNDYKFCGHHSGLPIVPYSCEARGQYNVSLYNVANDKVEEWTNANGLYKISRVRIDYSREWFIITRLSDNVVLFNSYFYDPNDYKGDPIGFDFYPFGGVLPVFRCRGFRAYARILTNYNSNLKPDYLHNIPDVDIVGRNSNYTKIYNWEGAIYGEDFFHVSSATQRILQGTANYSMTETKYGLFPNCSSDDIEIVYPSAKIPEGAYYTDDIVLINGWKPVIPVSRSQWVCFSLFMRTPIYTNEELYIDRDVTIRISYLLESILSKILEKIGSPVKHEATDFCSKILYGDNPINGEKFTLSITPKSNIINTSYSQSATKAVIKLNDIFKMLETTFGCKWYVKDGKLKIENWKYFNYGESYFLNDNISVDVTTKIYKGDITWEYGKNIVNYSKAELPSQIKFNWMDSQSKPFEGLPIEIISGYVNKQHIQENSTAVFSSDFDMIVASPSEISKDGFVLLASQKNGEIHYLPIKDVELEGYIYKCQNSILTFTELVKNYQLFNLPVKKVIVNGNQEEVEDLMKFKIQKISFPIVEDINPMQLIKTSVGKGNVEKISINLLRRFLTGTIKHKM